MKGTLDKSDTRLTVIGALGGYYILKPPSDQFAEMPENESVTMRMAEIFGIRVVPSSMIRLASGELSYISKRIDRTVKGEKIHMLDMFQITEAFDKYRSSMEKIGKALTNYSNNPLLDKIFLFELTIFSYLTGNNDMHLKNFSMIESQSGWILSPAYDLLNVSIVNPDDKEELALTLSGKKKKLTYKHFEQFGIELGLTQKQIEATFKRFSMHKSEALELINKSFFSEHLKVNYKTLFESRFNHLGLNSRF